MEKKVRHYEQILAGTLPDDTNPAQWAKKKSEKTGTWHLRKYDSDTIFYRALRRCDTMEKKRKEVSLCIAASAGRFSTAGTSSARNAARQR